MYNNGMDLMCMDYRGAADNRVRIKEGYALAWWLWYEAVVKRYPRNKRLPDGFYGSLPTVGNAKGRALHQYGFHDTNDKITGG